MQSQGQVEEKKIKVEKYYNPLFEVFVRMPTFVLDSTVFVDAHVSAAYLYEKEAKGNILLRWYAKRVDGLTPLYNDTTLYRNEFSFFQNRTNTLRSQLYSNKDGIPNTDLSRFTHPDRYGYQDPYVNTTNQPVKPLVQEWNYITEERRTFKSFYKNNKDTFRLPMAKIQGALGDLQGVQIRAEAFVTEFFYNNVQRGFCETRVINETLSLRFVGNQPMVFKPGMLFEGAVAVKYHDEVALTPKVLKRSELEIRVRAKNKNGNIQELKIIIVPKVQKLNAYQDIERRDHYGQSYGQEALNEGNKYDDQGRAGFDRASFFGKDAEKNTQFVFQDIYAKEKSFEEFRKTGVHRFSFMVPPLTEELYLDATHTDDESKVKTTRASATAYAAYGPKDRFIHVRSSSRNIAVGEYVVFHVKSNFPLPYFDWIIVSKNLIINSGREYGSDIHPIVNTFSVVVNSEMAPGFHIMVYTVTRPDDYLLSDSSYFPVQAINRHKIQFRLTQVKDHLKDTVEATCRGDPGAVFLSSTIRSAVFSTQGMNTITKASILESLHSFENVKKHIHRVFFTDREGSKPDEVSYYPSMDYGVDTNRTFELNEILIFTDFVFVPQTPFTRQCNISAGLFPCLHKDCFTEEQRCNGIRDCNDGLDEANCRDEFTEKQAATQRFRLSRVNRYTDFYDIGAGEWGWFDVNIDEDREQFYSLEVPLTTDTWFFNAFSISKEHGIGIMDEPITYDSIRPVHFYCEAPVKVCRGESVGIRCMIMNRSPYDLETVIILMGSDDYEFIHVGPYGLVDANNPETSKGDYHHLVFVRGQDEVEVHLPIKPTLTGLKTKVTAKITLSTQIMSNTQEVEIEITPEGSIVHRHTSVLLDLKSRAIDLEFMNIIVDETPIVPYDQIRRYIYGSPHGKVSISGDVIGPTFMNNDPVSLYTMFPDGNGRFGKGTEFHAFNLASNTWQLHYLRLTNQLQSNWGLAKRVFEQMNIEYAAIMRRFSSQGWVSIWDTAKPSVWLTSWCIKIFQHVSFQDWEDYIYIDPEVFGSAAMWLINYQNIDGAFSETEFYGQPLHKAMESKDVDGTKRNISLTAHVLISLHEISSKLQGEAKKYCSTSRQRAVRYLERNLPKITDPYDMAITAYALAISRSSEANAAHGKLMQMKRPGGYWSPTKIERNRERNEFNVPYLEAKDKQINDALAVETTAYALLTLFLVEGGGVTILQDQIVTWMNTMRLGNGGFISTVDTVVALEALVTYSYNSRIKDITNLRIELNLPDSNITDVLNIDGKGISLLRQIDIPNVWGTMTLDAKGAGQAVAQLDVNWSVDYETFKDVAPKQCFELTIDENLRGRNSSEIDVRSCFSWTCTEDSDTSGMAMLVMDIPSGYVMQQVSIFKALETA